MLIAAGAVLGFGVVLQRVVDHGLSSGSSAALNQALLLFLIVVTVMATSVAARIYLVTWIDERVVADIRKAVFAQVLKLEPAFFEVTRTGEVISRLTTDTSLTYGFARAYCEECGHDFLIAFSCKGRGICPSCNTRRMAETAAHLVDHVILPVPVRQWILSLPKRLRWHLHRDPALTTAVPRMFFRAVERTLLTHTKTAPAGAQLGAPYPSYTASARRSTRISTHNTPVVITVGRPVARPPPYRSPRAELPHGAPQSYSLRT